MMYDSERCDTAVCVETFVKIQLPAATTDHGYSSELHAALHLTARRCTSSPGLVPDSGSCLGAERSADDERCRHCQEGLAHRSPCPLVKPHPRRNANVNDITGAAAAASVPRKYPASQHGELVAVVVAVADVSAGGHGHGSRSRRGERCRAGWRAESSCWCTGQW